MTQGWLSIALLVVLLAMLPMGLKWLQRRMGGASLTSTVTTKIVSAIAVGPHQRVVTVEIRAAGSQGVADFRRDSTANFLLAYGCRTSQVS